MKTTIKPTPEPSSGALREKSDKAGCTITAWDIFALFWGTAGLMSLAYLIVFG